MRRYVPRDNSSIASPLLLSHLHKVYPSTVTIQTGTDDRNDDGEVVAVWANLANHVELSARIAPQEEPEQETDEQVFIVGTHRVALQGYYPSITEGMRAVEDQTGKVYDIERVQHDGGTEVRRSTYLDVEMKPGEIGA
jgi:head-tail adaptor